MTEWKIEKILELLNKCADLAMKYYDAPDSEIKEDRTVVTKADKEIEELLAGYFDNPSEGSYMIGEETVASRGEDYIKNALENTAWIVDPIDGTAPYANKVPTWGTSIAFAEKGVIKHGAIIMPPVNHVYITDGESDVLYSDKLVHRKEDLRKLVCPERKFDDSSLVCISQRMSKYGRFFAANPVQTVCSCVLIVAGILHGNFSSYITRVKVWDIAGGLPMLFRSGFRCILSGGRELTLEVDPASYILDPGSDERWAFRRHGIIARDRETIDFLFSKSELPDPE